MLNKRYGQAHEMSVIVAYAQNAPLNTHVDEFSGARGLSFELLFIYNQTLCMLAAKALVSRRKRPDSPEPLLLDIR